MFIHDNIHLYSWHYSKIIPTSNFLHMTLQRYLKSTLGNIRMIKRVLPESDTPTRDHQLFEFWLDFFVEGIKETVTSDVRFPVRISLLYFAANLIFSGVSFHQ